MAIVRSERSPAICSEANHPKMRISRNMKMPPSPKSAARVSEKDCSGAMSLSIRNWSSAVACLALAIARAKQATADDQFLIDNDIAPLQSFSLTLAALFGLGGIFMFLLIRIFGWLASEQIAGERSDRTIAILLSRPM